MSNQNTTLVEHASEKGAQKREIIVLIIPNEVYNRDVMSICKRLSKTYNNICYVSLNKLFDSLTKVFKDNDIDIKKIFVIDVMTKSLVRDVKETENCTFISSPHALTELNIAINKALDEKKFDAILFDSLSTILVYNYELSVVKFVHNLTERIRAANCTAIFTCLEGDTKSELIKDMGMFVDRIVRMGK